MRITVDIAPGLVSDETPYSTKGTWLDGNNVRFVNGRPEVIGGWERVKLDPGSPLSGAIGMVRNIHSWSDGSGRLNVLFGSNATLCVLRDGEINDISAAITSGRVSQGADFEDFVRTWALANWGENALASYREGPLFIWTNAIPGAFTEVTQAPDKIVYMLVTPERQVMAFGCNEELTGNFNRMCIRWSDIEDYTEWTTGTDNNAGEHILQTGGTRIVAARMFGQFVAVWTDTGVHLGQFIGAANQTYRFDLVDDKCGLIGPNAVIVVNQTAYWITQDKQFYMMQYGSPPVPLPCPIRADFTDNLVYEQKDKIISVAINQFGEVWWFYPDGRDPDLLNETIGKDCSRYIAFNTRTGTWFRGILQRNAAASSGPTQHPLLVASNASPGSILYNHELGHNADGGVLDWHIESGGMYLDSAERRMLARGIWPDFKDQLADIKLTIMTRDYPQASPRSKGPWVMAKGREKRDFLIEGRIFTFRFEGSAVGTFMRLGAPSVDVVGSGEN